MAEIFSFFEEGIKSYIEQSTSKYSKTPEIIFEKDFDNIILNPLFLNDIALYKNLIQKNKLKCELWKSIGELIFQKIGNISNSFKETINNVDTKILQYKERIKKLHKYIEDLKNLIVDREEKIKNNIDEDIKKKSNEKKKSISLDEDKEKDNNEEDDLSDVKLDDYNSKNNAILIEKISRYNKKIDEGEKSLENNERKIRHNNKKLIIGNINLLKINILNISVNILINEMNNNELNNDSFNKENNYKLLNEYINDLIEKCETVKEKININYILFMESFLIELVLIINNQGYKDINTYFLNQLLNNISNNQKKYSTSEMSNLVTYIEKLIKSPDSFLCPNAFSILKKASFKKVRPRSRNNSFDKNDINNEPKNNNNKNEKNSKIDDFFKKKKSESEEEEEDNLKRLSSVISFKNINQNNNFINNNNYYSQISFGLNENNSKIKFNSLSSAISNNTLLALDLQHQTSNMLNSSKLSGDDSMSLYKPSSYSELYPHDSLLGNKAGINSRLASHLPFLRISKKAPKKKNPAFDKFQKKLGKNVFELKNNKENSDKILKREISSIINDKFYYNENLTNEEKNKNTTASENKRNSKNKILFDDNQILKFKDKKQSNSNEILVSKTPVKLALKSEELKEEENNNENLQVNGIRKNLGALFNQQAGK